MSIFGHLLCLISMILVFMLYRCIATRTTLAMCFYLVLYDCIDSVAKLQKRFNSKNKMRNLTFCQEHCAEQVIKVLQPVDKQEDTESCN